MSSATAKRRPTLSPKARAAKRREASRLTRLCQRQIVVTFEPDVSLGESGVCDEESEGCIYSFQPTFGTDKEEFVNLDDRKGPLDRQLVAVLRSIAEEYSDLADQVERQL